MKKFGINHILKTLNKSLSSPLGSVVRDASVAGLSINPKTGVVATFVNSFYQNYNRFKIDLLLKGLSKGFNKEQRLYELNNYILSSSDRAYMVGNIFRETLASESPRVAELYGIILSKHIGSNESDFSHDELIVCKALENANDFDLGNFKVIMTNSLLDNHKGKPVWLPKDKQLSYDLTCQWCVYNRLFWDAGPDLIHNNTSMPDSVVGTNYLINSSANVLINYVLELGTSWDMNKKQN